jgi:hypothetical protein
VVANDGEDFPRARVRNKLRKKVGMNYSIPTGIYATTSLMTTEPTVLLRGFNAEPSVDSEQMVHTGPSQDHRATASPFGTWSADSGWVDIV